MQEDSFSTELAEGSRFAFGGNWSKFLATITDQRIADAQRDISVMLGTDDLSGKTFLDIGSGSGLSSLAARKLGAKVRSFDFDPASVACTARLKALYFPDDDSWNVERGSVLDRGYLHSLGQYDIVYAWGVLHHTGDLWTALDYASYPYAIARKAIRGDLQRPGRQEQILEKSQAALLLGHVVESNNTGLVHSLFYAENRCEQRRSTGESLCLLLQEPGNVPLL